MAGRSKDVTDVREIVRRLRMKQSTREIRDDLAVSWGTVKKYRRLAIRHGWLTAEAMPTEAEVAAAMTAAPGPIVTGPGSCVEAHQDKVLELLAKQASGVVIHRILRQQHGFSGSYSAVRRFIARHSAAAPRGFVRVEVAAGAEAQVDFGFAGRFIDPKSGRLRKAWVFVMTLSYSRHQYGEIVFDQTVETFQELHVRAFEFFGGVPRKIVIDNLKAGITRACFYDPQAQMAYRALAEHYGFLIAPCRVRTPRHKGKVERGVAYVKTNALAGRPTEPIDAANGYLRHWIMAEAGLRDHGTTHEMPLARFDQAEKAALLPLPEVRHEPLVYKLVKLHPDCHVVFDNAFYSAPHRLIGKQLLLKATCRRVELYFKHERIASHARATRAGERVSTYSHYPPEKVAGLLVTPERLRAQAAEIGPQTHKLICALLAERPVDRLRAAQGIVSMAKKYSADRLEAACARALACDILSYRTVATILKNNLDKIPLPAEVVSAGPVPKQAAFARPVSEIAVQIRRSSWN